MRAAATILVALDIAICLVVPSEAAHHKTQVHHVRASNSSEPQPHRVCDWVGPGGRAVYRCTVVESPQQTFLEPKYEPARPHCDWVGPGGRALYVCR